MLANRRTGHTDGNPNTVERTHQLVIALGSISTSLSSETFRGLIAAAQLSVWPCVTFRLSWLKSLYRFQTPTVLRKLPSQNITRYCAYFPCFFDCCVCVRERKL